PAISTGIYRFPPERAARIAVGTVAAEIAGASGIKRVVFCCFSPGCCRAPPGRGRGAGLELRPEPPAEWATPALSAEAKLLVGGLEDIGGDQDDAILAVVAMPMNGLAGFSDRVPRMKRLRAAVVTDDS